MKLSFLAIIALAIIGALFMGCKEKSEMVKKAEKEEVSMPKKEAVEEKNLTGKKVVMIIAP